MAQIKDYLKNHKWPYILLLLSVVGLFLAVHFHGKDSSFNKEIEEDDDGKLENVIADIPTAYNTIGAKAKSESYLEEEESTRDDIFDIEDYWNHLEKESFPDLNDSAKVSFGSGIDTLSDEEVPFKTKSLSELFESEASQTQTSSLETPRPIESQSQRQERHQRSQQRANDIIREYSKDSFNPLEGLSESSSGKEEEDFFCQEEEPIRKSIHCMFSHDMKVSSGEMIPILLLEDLDAFGVNLPKGSTLMGKCDLSSGRLYLCIESLKGKTNPDSNCPLFEAYDLFGAKGLGVSSLSEKGVKENTQSRVNVSSIISFLPSEVISLGSSILSSDEKKVHIDAGYDFYLQENN